MPAGFIGDHLDCGTIEANSLTSFSGTILSTPVAMKSRVPQFFREPRIIEIPADHEIVSYDRRPDALELADGKIKVGLIDSRVYKSLAAIEQNEIEVPVDKSNIMSFTGRTERCT
jgi:hypothetical protein